MNKRRQKAKSKITGSLGENAIKLDRVPRP